MAIGLRPCGGPSAGYDLGSQRRDTAVGSTPIYTWPLPDLPDSADGPTDIGDLGRAIETTVNINNTKRVLYQHQANFNAPVGVNAIGGWPPAGGFVGNATGLTVPEAGLYTVYFGCVNLSRTPTNPLTGLRINSSFGCNAYLVPNQTAGFATITLPCSAGGQINTYFLNQEGVAFTALLQLYVSKVSP